MIIDAVRLHPLTYLEDGDQVVIGRTDTDSYGMFPPDGAALLRKLAAGMTPVQAADWYASVYDERVDIAGFLGVLDELGFLVAPGETPAIPAPPRWQRLGQWMFSPVAWASYLLLIGGAAVVMVTRPRLAPHTGNLFFTHYLTILELVLVLGQLPLLLLHECFHMLAGRRLGLRSSLRLSWRLNYLVFETALDGLVTVERRRRYLPMLAGMLADLLAIAVLTLIAAVTLRPDGSVPIAAGVGLALAYGTLLRLAWQLYFYLRTDLYYVVATVLGCTDLHAASRRLLGNRFRRLLRRPPADESALHPRDRTVGRWYSWLLLSGYAFTLLTVALALVPAVWRMLDIVWNRVSHGTESWHQVADSAVFLVLNVGQLLVIVVLALSRRHSRGDVPAR